LVEKGQISEVVEAPKRRRVLGNVEIEVSAKRQAAESWYQKNCL